MAYRCRRAQLGDYLSFLALDAAQAQIKESVKEVRKERRLTWWEALIALGATIFCQFEKNELNDQLCVPIPTLFNKSSSSDREITFSRKKITVSKKSKSYANVYTETE